jgi:UDP-N-acetylglucosamine--N-acetylmuramyl-(pentapeptide) pyrophosphoryl-undecaprenol N-acetylglucosamine transferase
VRTLLVASSGGHLQQLHRLVPRMPGLSSDLTWVTYPTEQSRSLLAGQCVVDAHLIESRDYRGIALNAWLAAGLLRRQRFSRVVSTGSAIALSFLPVARARRIPCHYIESVARSAAPSATGRVLRWVPGVRLYAQYPGWATGPWRYLGSVFDEFELEPELRPETPLRRVVVTVGTSTLYGFRRLMERLVEVLPGEAQILWQTGVTDVRGLPIPARFSVPGDELDRAMREADVVIAHAGAGSALSALEAGHAPVLVPRRQAFGENIDDHQILVSAELARRGLAIDVRPETLTLADLATAARLQVRITPDPPPCHLVEP